MMPGAHRTCIITFALSTFTLCVGIYAALNDDDDIALWVVAYCHFCDDLCHSIMLSAYVSLLFDAAVAAMHGHLWELMKQLLNCYDSIEAHAVSGHHDGNLNHAMDQCFLHRDAAQAARHARCRPYVKAARLVFIWSVFLFVAWAYIMANYFEHSAPPWTPLFIDLLGCFCWAGITWWIVESMIQVFLGCCCRGYGHAHDNHLNDGSFQGSPGACFDTSCVQADQVLTRPAVAHGDCTDPSCTERPSAATKLHGVVVEGRKNVRSHDVEPHQLCYDPSCSDTAGGQIQPVAPANARSSLLPSCFAGMMGPNNRSSPSDARARSARETVLSADASRIPQPLRPLVQQHVACNDLGCTER